MLRGLSDLRADAVVHMAAISDTTCRDWEKLKAVNIDWTLRLADDCCRQGIPFLYASSASVYGNGLGPLNLYARSKAMVDEVMATHQGMWYGLRFFNVWGAGEEHKGAQASIIHQFQCGKRTFWAPDARRDFVHVSDCVDVARWMIERAPPSGIYDIGTGVSVSFAALAARYGSDPQVVPIPKDILPHYQFDTCADLAPLRVAGYAHTFKEPITQAMC